MTPRLSWALLALVIPGGVMTLWGIAALYMAALDRIERMIGEMRRRPEGSNDEEGN